VSSEKRDIDNALTANLSRRAILGAGVGLGSVALAGAMGLAPALGNSAAPVRADLGPDKGVMRTGQVPARAKRVVSMHMWGAISQVDTFDYKPTLIKRHAEEIPPSVKNKGGRISSQTNGQSSFPLVKPLWDYRQYGETGTWASDLMRHTGMIADQLTFIHTMNTEHVNHDPAAIFLNTGFQLAGRPSAGAWVNYALGTDNANLPSYVVMTSKFQSIGVAANSAAWSSGFLPSQHQGVDFRAGADPVLYIGNPQGVDRQLRRDQLDFIGAMSRTQYATSGDPEILSKISQYEMAYRMQDSVPDVADLSDEPDYILDLYGPEVHTPGSFARNCLLTRRLIERDVKYVQLIHVGWDHHTRLFSRHPGDCYSVDQPSAALVTDLKQRGLLDDTLVMFGGEFGRTSYAQGALSDLTGRDHHGGCFTYWLAGGGVKAGHHHGQTDEFSYNIEKDPVSVHDLHATMMYLLGIDHKQLTYHYQGRDFRLTDVHGEVVTGVLA
jgi:hypothetical protein